MFVVSALWAFTEYNNGKYVGYKMACIDLYSDLYQKLDIKAVDEISLKTFCEMETEKGLSK